MGDELGGLLGLAIGTSFAVAAINQVSSLNRRKRRRLRRRHSVRLV